MNASIIDLAVPVIILWELLMGLRRGLSGELFRLLGTGLVLAIGLSFYEDFGLMIANHSRLTQNQEMAVALAFLLIVAVMGICFFLLRIVLTLLMQVKFNDAFDRPAGGVAGILRGGLIAVLLIFAVGLWPNEKIRSLITVDSYAGKTVFRFAPVVTEKIRSLHILFQPSAPQPAPKPDKKTTSKAEL
ncbi:MAG: CvpA family protein [Kiritimatiellia bacterium]|nr:CvpA family protein [Kiritimatiellia bacterium]